MVMKKKKIFQMLNDINIVDFIIFYLIISIDIIMIGPGLCRRVFDPFNTQYHMTVHFGIGVFLHKTSQEKVHLKMQ